MELRPMVFIRVVKMEILVVNIMTALLIVGLLVNITASCFYLKKRLNKIANSNGV